MIIPTTPMIALAIIPIVVAITPVFVNLCPLIANASLSLSSHVSLSVLACVPLLLLSILTAVPLSELL